MKKFVHFLEKAEEFISSITLPVMCIVIFVNTFGRYTKLFQLFWAEELARYLMVWSVYMGAAAASSKGEHFAVDVIVSRLPKTARYIAYGLQILLNFIFCAFILYYGFRLVGLQTKLGQVSATMRLPMWFMYSAMPVCTLLMLFQYTSHVIAKIREIGHETPGEEAIAE